MKRTVLAAMVVFGFLQVFIRVQWKVEAAPYSSASSVQAATGKISTYYVQDNQKVAEEHFQAAVQALKNNDFTTDVQEYCKRPNLAVLTRSRVC